MKEQLYTIPVNEALEKECECPVCAMRQELEKLSLEYTLGPSYMEDDVRMVTDKAGFCATHAKELYRQQNRLGLALILKTHMDRTIKDVERLAKGPVMGGGLFKKKSDAPVVEYLKKLSQKSLLSLMDQSAAKLKLQLKQQKAWLQKVEKSLKSIQT